MILKIKASNWTSKLEVLVDGVDVRNVDSSKELTFIRLKESSKDAKNDLIELINDLDPNADAKLGSEAGGKEDVIIFKTSGLYVRAIDSED